MEIRHLRYFIAVAKTLHFGAAAESLGIATPTLSVQIKQLERELGSELFRRHNRSVELNEAGRLFLIEAQDILNRTAKAIEIGRRAGRGELGELRIGYISSALWSGVLSKIITSFKASAENVNVIVREEQMVSLPLKICEGVLDAAFIRGPVVLPEELESITVSRDCFCVALPEMHPLASIAAPLQPSDLNGYPLILPEQQYGTREVARRGGFKVNDEVNAGSLIDVLARISFGEGIAVIPEVLSHTISLPQIVFRPIAGPAIPSEINLVYRHGDLSPLVKRLIQTVDRIKH